MSFDIQFKETESAQHTVVGYNDLKARIQRGEVGPKSLVCDRVITNEQWWTLDNLNIFHRLSPTSHPAGEHLRRKQEIAEQAERARERSFALLGSYMRGDLIDECYELAALSEMCRATAVCGVTRLYVLCSFQPERIFTFIFRHSSIQIEAAQGSTSLWSSLPQVLSQDGVWKEMSGPPFDPAVILRAIAEVPCYDVHKPFNQWQEVVATTRLATSCSSPVLDGVGFRHQLVCPAESLTSEWRNPSPNEHAAQHGFLKAYRDLIAAANLGQFWPAPKA